MPTTLIITNDFPPRIGGIESFVGDICELLDGDVVVYASGPPGSTATDAVRRYPVVRDGSLLLPTPRVARNAGFLLRRFGATRVIFGAAAPLGLLAPSLRRAGAQAVVGLTHGHETWWATLPGTRQVVRRIGSWCDHLTAISEYTSARIRPALSPAAAGRMLRLVPPVDTKRFTPAPRADGRRRCVAVGRLVAHKGFTTLLRAWRLVLQLSASELPELILVGGGPDRLRVESMIKQLDLTDAVTITGAIPRAQVITTLQQADVFALPVRTRLCGLNPEGLGIAALEAAATGLPVVIGNSGGAPETVRHGSTGFVVDPNDHVEFARRISALLADADLRRAMGAAGRSMVQECFGAEQARATLRLALRL
jgi:phosphatidyl-myo-inositol dimannoside synthase